jgi:putative SOS response-associated peptidase YedK
VCGRYYRRSDKQRIAEAFKLGRLPEGFELPPDWNIAPSTNQPIIRSDPETGEREMVLMRWGLIPAKIANPDAFKSPHPPLDSFSIVTTEANELMAIHDRMPVILHPRDYDRWLNDFDESRLPIDLLRPYEAEGMLMTPANRAVGNVRNNGPEMLNSA